MFDLNNLAKTATDLASQAQNLASNPMAQQAMKNIPSDMMGKVEGALHMDLNGDGQTGTPAMIPTVTEEVPMPETATEESMEDSSETSSMESDDVLNADAQEVSEPDGETPEEGSNEAMGE